MPCRSDRTEPTSTAKFMWSSCATEAGRRPRSPASRDLRFRRRLLGFSHGHDRSAHGEELDEVLREPQVERPVDCDPELLLEPWQFTEVDRSPQPPCEKSREVESEHARHTRATAD